MAGDNTAEHMDIPVAQLTHKDSYFLDRDLALKTALENNIVHNDSGQSH